MSYLSEELDEADISISGNLTVDFDCPRCGQKQSRQVAVQSLEDSQSFDCANKECGVGNAIIVIQTSVRVSANYR